MAKRTNIKTKTDVVVKKQTKPDNLEPTISRFTVDQLPAPDIFATIPKEQTVTIIVPLYEMVKDGPITVINYQMLEVALLRLRSYFHKSYLVFIGEINRTSNDTLAVVQGHIAAHNTLYSEVEPFSSLGMYLQQGIDVGRTQTDSQYFIFATPWQMIGNHSIDVLLERINRPDVAICSGFDTRLPAVHIGFNGISPAEFDNVIFNPAREMLGININLFGMTKAIADTIQFDPNYQTRQMLEHDLFQLMKSRSSNVIISQQVPIYTFKFDWSAIEGQDAIAADNTYFQQKWGFTVN
jgi:hypothetical protein